ncbi:chemotaxis response regulator protein-glutamate methylesterase [Clostridium sp. KNHs214]|uniref:protein-glutamate methylesterase/protein-glutamine glutaminase n=1 Tax=Clostridium sp. KNHs214 TaxID=1540257 RepID=UPI0005535A50|nr:chemotaxis response regulator protein-glutamate methylesterase [Clostridium sp. KNHs214]
MERKKVMVVDDSALMRKIISDMINEQEDMEVVAVGRNGEELLEKVHKINPDVITMDLEMPKIDGMTALNNLKSKNIQIPVIILSSISNRGPSMTMDCLERGAFDFLAKPSGNISLDIKKVKDELIEKIRVAYSSKKQNIKKINIQYKEINSNDKLKRVHISCNKVQAVAIGASTGGPKALYNVITHLPGNIGIPIFVVQHMPVGFTKAFSERLDKNSKLKVVEASEGENIENNTVYVAPGGFHMEVGLDKRIHLNKEPSIWGVRPAVDKLFFSAADLYRCNLLSVVLTGMGRDGANGTAYIKEKGGITISEDESTCTIYGMPKAAYETGKVDMVLPLNAIADEIIKIVSNKER